MSFKDHFLCVKFGLKNEMKSEWVFIGSYKRWRKDSGLVFCDDDWIHTSL